MTESLPILAPDQRPLELSPEDFPTRFLKKYLARHGHVQIFGMRKALPLSKTYVTVTVATQDSLESGINVKGVVEDFSKRASVKKQNLEERQNGMDVASKYQHLVVLGQPGAGKSTFSRRVGLEALSNLDRKEVLGIRKARFKHKCLPVFIELKRLNPPEMTIEKLVEEEMKIFSPDPDSWKRLMEAGQVLFLLDGYDEIPAGKMDLAIPQVRDFVDRYRENRFIISCRTAVYRTGWLSSFVQVEVNDFDDAQVESYITAWFRYQVDSAREARPYVKLGKELWETLQRPLHSATLELARTPLLLVFLCLTFRKTQQLASSRSKLYKRALQILIEEWASEKLLHHRRPAGLDFEVELELLADVAGPAFQANKLAFTQAELITEIGRSLKSRVVTPSFKPEDVFKAAVEEQGLIVQRAEDVHTFSHLTLHEFLAAHHFARLFTLSQREEMRRGYQMLKEKVLDRRWQEVFLLLTGLVDSDTLLDFIAAVPQQLLGKNPRLSKLLLWVESIPQAGVDESKAAGVRAFALGIFIQFHLLKTCGGQVNPFSPREFSSQLTFLESESGRAIADCADLCRSLTRGLDPEGQFDLTRSPGAVDGAAGAIHTSPDLHLDRLLRQSFVMLSSCGYVSADLLKRVEALLASASDTNLEDPSGFAEQIFREGWLLPDNSGFEGWDPAAWRVLGDYLHGSSLVVHCQLSSELVKWESWTRVLACRLLRHSPLPSG